MTNLPSETAKFESVGDIYLEQSTLMLRHDTIIQVHALRLTEKHKYVYSAQWKHLPSGTTGGATTEDENGVVRPTPHSSVWTALREAIDAAYNWIEKQATQQR